jgi:hypothetical protein
MYDRYIFAVSSANATESTQLTRPKRRDQSSGAFDSGVSVGGVGPNELIRSTNP